MIKHYYSISLNDIIKKIFRLKSDTTDKTQRLKELMKTSNKNITSKDIMITTNRSLIWE